MSEKKQSKQLGLWNLVAMVVGGIIGAGIFSILGSAIAITGRSVVFSIAIAIVMVTITTIPLIYLPSVIKLEGGTYTQGAIMLPRTLAGTYALLNLLCAIGFSMYAISMASYLADLIPALYSFQKVVALVILIGFFLMGLRGTSFLSKVQNIMVLLLLAALGVFIFGGLPHVQPGFFEPEGFMLGGPSAMLIAATMMTSAATGGTAPLNAGNVAKNPKRDIPLSMLLGLLIVGVLYIAIAVIAAGVLPLEQVMGQSLGVVAKTFLPTPLFLFFVIGGALFALGTTLNATLTFIHVPVTRCAQDGWLPKVLSKRDRKFNYPYVLMSILLVVAGVLPIVFGLPITTIVALVSLPFYLAGLLYIISLRKIPRMFPKQWKNSSVHVPNWVFYGSLILGGLMSCYQIYNMLKSLPTSFQIGGVATLVIVYLYCLYRDKRGYVHMEYVKDLIEGAEAAATSAAKE